MLLALSCNMTRCPRVGFFISRSFVEEMYIFFFGWLFSDFTLYPRTPGYPVSLTLRKYQTWVSSSPELISLANPSSLIGVSDQLLCMPLKLSGTVWISPMDLGSVPVTFIRLQCKGTRVQTPGAMMNKHNWWALVIPICKADWVTRRLCVQSEIRRQSVKVKDTINSTQVIVRCVHGC